MLEADFYGKLLPTDKDGQKTAIARVDFATKQELVDLLVNSITWHAQKAIVESNVALGPSDASAPLHHKSPLLHAIPCRSPGIREIRVPA